VLLNFKRVGLPDEGGHAVGGSGKRTAAATWYSDDDNVGLRLQSDAPTPQNVYFELRNAKSTSAWAMGVGTDNVFRVAYGPAGSALNKRVTAMEIHPDRSVVFHKDVHFHAQPSAEGSMGYLGCYQDNVVRALRDKLVRSATTRRETCRQWCAGYTYFGLQDGKECWCGNGGFDKYGRLGDEQCATPCAGNSQSMCGGKMKSNVYRVSIGEGSLSLVAPTVTATATGLKTALKQAFFGEELAMGETAKTTQTAARRAIEAARRYAKARQQFEAEHASDSKHLHALDSHLSTLEAQKAKLVDQLDHEKHPGERVARLETLTAELAQTQSIVRAQVTAMMASTGQSERTTQQKALRSTQKRAAILQGEVKQVAKAIQESPDRAKFAEEVSQSEKLLERSVQQNTDLVVPAVGGGSVGASLVRKKSSCTATRAAVLADVAARVRDSISKLSLKVEADRMANANSDESSDSQEQIRLKDLLNKVLRTSAALLPTAHVNLALADEGTRRAVEAVSTSQLQMESFTSAALCAATPGRLLLADNGDDSSMADLGDARDSTGDVTGVLLSGEEERLPAVKYYSDDSDASIRVESRSTVGPREVYLELAAQRGYQGYQVGMRNDFSLHFSYGRLGGGRVTAHDALVMQPGGGLLFHGNVVVMGKAVKAFPKGFERGSGIACAGGSPQVTNHLAWSGWSACPAGHTAVGIQSLSLSNVGAKDFPSNVEVDHYQCDHRGCRAKCPNSGELSCRVVARCCRTQKAALGCYNANYQAQPPNQWGKPSYCDWRGGYRAVGFGRLDLLSGVPSKHTAMVDSYVGWHYTQAWCRGERRGGQKQQQAPGCAVQARCCSPREGGMKLHCVHGSKGFGPKNAWGEWSVCPPAFTALGVMRSNLLHKGPGQRSMGKYECKSDAKNRFEGCRAWGWASPHNTWAKCCRLVPVQA